MNSFYDRLRVTELEVEEGAKSVARISLTWTGNGEFVGQSDSTDGPERAAADAAAQALELALGSKVAIAVRGIEVIERFDALVALIDFDSEIEKRKHTLVGSCLIRDDDTGRAAALAVLDATNQLIGTNLVYLQFRAQG